MSMNALGAYFGNLRIHHGLSRASLAAQLGVSEMSIWRIEKEGQEPRTELLVSLVRVLNAKWHHIEQLASDPDCNEETAQKLATEAYIAASELSDDDLQEILNLYERLKDDPRALMRWLGYGQSLGE